MDIFIAVCLAVLVVELGILVAVMVRALLQIRKTALAVEVLTYRIDRQVAAFGETVRSGWVQLFQTILSLAGRYFGKNP